MNTKMKSVFKILVWPIGIALAIALFFADNIRGYYRFKEICARDAGLHVYQPLERNVGWTVSGGRMDDTGFMVQFNEVAFVRYHDEKDGNWYDVYRVPKLKVGDGGYARQPVDVSKSPVYKYEVQLIHDLPGEIRMGATHSDITDLRTGTLAARYSEFGYSKFELRNTILAAPSGEGCPESFSQTDPKTGKPIPSKMTLALISAFAK